MFFTTSARLQVQGDSRRLIDFVSRIREASAKSVIISAVGISNTQPLASMALDLSMYASNFATGEALVSAQLAPSNPDGPIALPTLAPAIGVPATGVPATNTPTVTNPENQLVQQLDAAWATQNWPVVINTLEQIQTIDPNYPNLVVKLYAAHVNFGYQLLNAGRLDDARAEFTRALQINPSGGEATAALNQLTTPTATPASRTTTYVVQTGDTLFSIARRFGVALDALMAANGLTSFGIRIRQQLIIPLP
jgi:LysM repeat protein